MHEQSCECTKSELDLFSVPPTQTSMESGNWIEYHPLTAVADGSPIEFEIGGSGEDYIDFGNSMLYVQAKITQPDGNDLGAAANTGPVNLFLHSLFFSSGHTVEWNSDHVVDEYLSLSSDAGNAIELRRGREEDSTVVGPITRSHGSARVL